MVPRRDHKGMELNLKTAKEEVLNKVNGFLTNFYDKFIIFVLSTMLYVLYKIT